MYSWQKHDRKCTPKTNPCGQFLSWNNCFSQETQCIECILWNLWFSDRFFVAWPRGGLYMYNWEPLGPAKNIPGARTAPQNPSPAAMRSNDTKEYARGPDKGKMNERPIQSEGTRRTWTGNKKERMGTGRSGRERIRKGRSWNGKGKDWD